MQSNIYAKQPICHSTLHIQEPPAAVRFGTLTCLSFPFVDRTEDFTVTGQPGITRAAAHHSRERKG